MKTQTAVPEVLDYPTSSINTIDIRIDKKEVEILTEDCTCIIDEVELVKIIDLETKMPLPVVAAPQPTTTATPRKGMPKFLSRLLNRLSVLPLTLPLCLVLVLGLGNVCGQIQLSEGFESGLPTAYTTTTSYSLGSGTWTGSSNQVLRATTGVKTGTYSLQLRSQTGAQVISPNLSVGGVSTITFWGSASTTSGSVQVNYSTDGGATWNAASGSPFSLTTGNAVQKTATINSNSQNILIQFYRAAATVYIDDVVINTSEPTTQ